MNIAIVGCGYVSEFYLRTLQDHPELHLTGAFDIQRENLDAFCRLWQTRAYASMDELLADPQVALVLNLTNPRSHFEITRQCLQAGKHVYSEKPLAMNVDDARVLAALAQEKNLMLSSAPCSVLGETAQTLIRAVHEGKAGKVRLVYANFDDGMIAPRQQPWNWRNASGAPWPAKDEFEVGCTYEHAAYQLSWLVAMFGPVRKITSFASCQIPDKGIAVDEMAPDFTVGILEFADGVVARITCGLVAPRDKSLTVVGDDAVLFVGNVRDDYSPVFLRPAQPKRWQSFMVRHTRWLARWLESRWQGTGPHAWFQRRLPMKKRPAGRRVDSEKPVDFLLGPSEMAAALENRRPSRLSTDLAVHLLEIVERLQFPERNQGSRLMKTTVRDVVSISRPVSGH